MLDLSNIRITDRGVRELGNFKNLQTLCLTESQTMERLNDLAVFTNLKELQIVDLKTADSIVRDRHLAQIQKTLPNCRIVDEFKN